MLMKTEFSQQKSLFSRCDFDYKLIPNKSIHDFWLNFVTILLCVIHNYDTECHLYLKKLSKLIPVQIIPLFRVFL